MTKKLMTHMVCGYPNIAESQKIFNILKEKSEYLEIQFPFSDPIADWPVIEKANKIALENWMTTEKCFDFVENCREWIFSFQNQKQKFLFPTT